MRYLLALALLIAPSSVSFAAEQKVTLAVDKMICALCPITVRKAIEHVDGVKSVKVDYGTKTAVVVFDDAVTDWQQLATASTNAGYPATKRQ
jgi:mercuric ion binding protein